jgi:hypothetical protein
MRIEELAKILDGMNKDLSRLQKHNEDYGDVLYGEEKTKLTLARLGAKKELLDFIRELVREPDCRNDSDVTLSVFVKTGNRVATIETSRRYKDQDITLRVRVSEIPDSEELKIEYLHTEDSGEVLQEIFYSQSSFWDLVHHEVEKLKKLKKLNDSDNHLRWKANS